ncbi:MAG: biopolymer transporter ExbD [Myxococcales bacterium]|nr:biopolymer transporter ExbD [Polyangiaceae bacterium]MDW8249773.1 biopolymer transporter ExbD [Myxococcales bacterium]
MGGVSVDSGGGGRRSVDSEINMVPMIDLLMCLICFLLITAVWSTMARINADAQVPGPPDPNKPVEEQPPPPMMHVTIQEEKFIISWRKGNAVESTLDVPRKPVTIGEGKRAQVRFPDLAEKIIAEWNAKGAHRDPSDKKLDQAVLHCDNKTPYKEIIAVIDAIYQAKREFPGSNGKKYPAMNVTFSMHAN